MKGHYWYNYLYTKEELKPWVEKVEQVKKETKILRVYFNNHYGRKMKSCQIVFLTFNVCYI